MVENKLKFLAMFFTAGLFEMYVVMLNLVWKRFSDRRCLCFCQGDSRGTINISALKPNQYETYSIENFVLCFYGTLFKKLISMHNESNFILLNRPSRKKFLELIYVTVNSLVSTNWIIKKYSWLVKWAIFLLWCQDIFFSQFLKTNLLLMYAK